MTKKDFVKEFAIYYAIDVKNESNKSKISYMTKWLDDKEELEKLLENIISEFIPTSINPFPLIPHLNESYNKLGIVPAFVKELSRQS